MDDDTDNLLRELCTRVGCIMEDASVTALVWSDDLTIEQRLQALATAASDIQALVAAARTLTPRQQ